ncbi:MAG TPA: RNA methyltransferase [Bacteroidales bacterium]|nr:RNA methyltransferase [Bacteroidales bacterium]
MISKNRSKFITGLQKKKNRDEENLFVIEGDKLVREFLKAKRRLKLLVAKPEFISSLDSDWLSLVDETESVSYDELRQLSSLKTPHNAIAIVPKLDLKFDYDKISEGLTAALDCVQDPGNLGTIIRAAAWFGIKNIVCSIDCVDVYNPKVIQASMGAVLHVNVHYTDLKEFLLAAKEKSFPVYGTLLEGVSLYDHKLDNKGIIIFGNESKGISGELIPLISDRIMIPGANKSKPGIESLNVGMAASVVFSEFARRISFLPAK